MKLGAPEIIIIVTLFVVLSFTIIRARHYFYARKYEGHDSYITVVEKDGKYQKCPRLEMWGFKMSVVIFLLSLNFIFMLYLTYKLLKKSN